MPDVDSQIQLLKGVAATLERFAEALTREQADEDVLPEQPPRPADEHALGRRQLQIVELTGLATEEGLKTAEIAAAIGYELPNTYSALQALVRNQVVEQVPGKEPQHWRLMRRYRAGARAFARVAKLVKPGEWTTAGDISIALRGDTRASDGVVRAGLSHRVLVDGKATETRGRLEAEGVVFLEDGRADPRQRVPWDELARRVAAAEERRSRVAKGTLNYVQIPAADLERSATFYEEVFGWQINRYPAVSTTDAEPQTAYVGFVDTSGHVGGEFVLGRAPSGEPGLLPSLHVESIDETLAAVVANGGEVVKPRTAIVEGKDWQGIFRDPGGNLFALYEAAEA